MSKRYFQYRVDTTRIQSWDYGWNGAYFVTINTKFRTRYFGTIDQLSEVGQIANTIWHLIPDKFSFALLDVFVVMPDHIHGIVIIDKKNGKSVLKPGGGITGNKNPMLHKNLSTIIRWYKGRVTFEARKVNPEFTWQSRFDDRIIWTEEYYLNIRNYIRKNPENWKG